MAWTAPRTYVANEVVTAAILNTDHRDNLLALSTHAHTGAAGDGDDDLTGLDTLTFDDQAANPAVAGRAQRNGNDLYWYGSALVKITNHTHSFLQDGTDADSAALPDSSTVNAKTMANGTTHSSTSSVSPGKTSRVCGFASVYNLSGSPNMVLDLIIDGVIVATTTMPDLGMYVLSGSREVSSGARTVEAKVTNNVGSNAVISALASGAVAVNI